MKILITGVAGFIGSNLAERLIEEGYEVIGIDNLEYGIFEQIPKGVKFHKIDIRNKNIYPLFKGVDFVFHLAAKNCISDCQIDPVETFDINITGTANIFEAAKQNNVKKIIYAESSAMYEGSTIYPTPEYDVKPLSFYANSKMCTMLLAETYSRYSSLKFTALRYFCVYGPKQDYRRTIPPVFSSFIIKLLKNEQPMIYGNGTKKRDFIHVDDINDFHILCLTDDRTTNKVFNLGSGQNYSINQIYDIISKLLNSKIKPIYKNDLDGESLENLADITEAKKLGWYPKIDLENGLKTSIEFIKKRLEIAQIYDMTKTLKSLF
ncbi:NAD-dependent epimerase/dehydratase family protein [Candidatus Dojkabacteria bacterium]|jgi:UDP-glucose 4-epimerase|nr:NAD-dependent epimerase/dehydratase family protein [Candidatus Dojkabacteria bacterium]